MFYPFGNKENCETQPLITVRNITFRNIESHGGILPPGVLRGNETNPLTDINFENVKLHGIWRYFAWTYYTEDVYGTAIDTHPVPKYSDSEAEGSHPLGSNLIYFIADINRFF